MRIIKEQSAGLIIDIQEKLLPHIHDNDALLARTDILIRGLQILDVPMLVTEQYTKGLGFTVEPVKSLFREFSSSEKISFSCCDDPGFFEKFKSLNRRFVIIAGIETHVCVLQTVLDLLEKNYLPVVVSDCVSSRNTQDKEIALRRIEKSGGIVTSAESILFELTRFAGSDTFKSISRLVK